MFRLLLFAVLFAVSIKPVWSQSPEHLETAIYRALNNSDVAALKIAALKVEALLDGGQAIPGKSRTASIGLVGQAFLTMQDMERALKYYGRAVAEAHKEDLTNARDGLLARTGYAQMLILSNREEDGLFVASRVLQDVKAVAPTSYDPQFEILEAMFLAYANQLDWGAAAEIGREMRSIGESQFGARDRRTHSANKALSQSLYRAGRVREALPFARRSLELLAYFVAPNSEEYLSEQIQLAHILIDLGTYEEARALLDETKSLVETQFASTEVGFQAQSAMARLYKDDGAYFAMRAERTELIHQLIENGTAEQKLEGLEALASNELAELRGPAYEKTLLDIISLVGNNPELPRRNMGNAIRRLAELTFSERRDFPMAKRMILDARRILSVDPGRGSHDWLEAEATLISFKFTESRLVKNSQNFGALPVFFDGTIEDARVTKAELDILQKLSLSFENLEKPYAALTAWLNYASALGGVGRTAEAVDILETLLDRNAAARAAGDSGIFNIDTQITSVQGIILMNAGRYKEAAELYRNNINNMLGMLRNGAWLGPMLNKDLFAIAAQLYGQNYASALWHQGLTQSERNDRTLIASALEASQMAGYGPASASVSRGRLRRLVKNPELATLFREWDVISHFGSGISVTEIEDPNARLAERSRRGERISELHKEILARYPDYFHLQVREPVTLSEIAPISGRGGLLDDDEALIVILPSRPLGEASDINGMVIAITKEDVAWAEMGTDELELAGLIGHYQNNLDPPVASRAPLAALEDARDGAGKHNLIEFPFRTGARLFDVYFGDRSIQAVIDTKPNWTIVPFGMAITTPFAALVTSDPGPRKLRSPDEFRQIRWLGHERALSVYPSVSALKDLRLNRDKRPADGAAQYIGFGDPNFDGGPDLILPTADQLASARGRDLSKAIASLRRLPGTRYEVEYLGKLFGGDKSSTYLGAQATEKRVRQLAAAGDLSRAEIVHFATHGIVTGGFDGLSEPSLALTPVLENTTSENDGLLTASEASMLDISADWVILSACDTAEPGGGLGEGLGGLVQGFLAGGAKAMLVSHWEVGDVAALVLVTETVKKARNGTGKAEALRQAMIKLSQERSLDDRPYSNAHPANWAPFFIVGGA